MKGEESVAERKETTRQRTREKDEEKTAQSILIFPDFRRVFSFN